MIMMIGEKGECGDLKKKKKRGLAPGLVFLLVLLLAAALLIRGRFAARNVDAPRDTPHASGEAAPAESTVPEPPHVHDYDPETGLCRGCGESCPHGEGYDESFRCRVCGMACPHPSFSETGVCLACGWLCPHERHDPESACCLVCGAQRWHSFGAAGLCACSREAPLTQTVLADEYFEPAEHEGRCLHETLTDASGREHEIAIWLPWDYNEETRYNVVLLIHGDGGSCYDWVDQEEPTSRGLIQVFRVYDRLAERHLCAPFLVVGLNNRGMGDDPAFGEMLIEELILPYLARSYSTWMEGDSHEQIVAAREHIAIGGLSRGSVFTYYIAMQRCLDVAANFCCFSNSYTGTVIRTLNSEDYLSCDIRCYVAEIGLRDVAEYNRDHRAMYDALCTQVERIADGKNARFLEIDEGHNFLMWTAAIYNALLLMF
jgi:enterochelin esterase-like enzyme